MKIELGTEKLKSAVNKVYKGVGQSGIFLTTTLIGIEGKGGNLTLMATDRAANIKVTLNGVIDKDADFYTNTVAERFKKLLDRTQSATVTLDIQKDRIVFSGSGDASLEIIYNDEDGEATLARMQNIVVSGEPKTVKISDLKKFLTYLKGTLPVSIDNPVYLGYRVFNNKAMTYNNFGANLIEIGWDEEALIPSNVVSLFETLEGDTAQVTVADNKIKVATENIEITGALRKDVAEYNTTRFTNLIYNEQMFDKKVVVDRVRLVSALDRIRLFIGKDDEKVFDVEIDKNSMMFITFAKNCVEKIDFEESENESIMTHRLGIDVFEAALSAIKGQKVVINFGVQGGCRLVEESEKAYLLVPYARERKR